ncbi:hypothetical protein QTG56_23435 (plasmid) [Rossellomorea sp. AcN35-11]|nr:hypothetical protein [Rossellomorea aquimaris]WJV32318.1 hypothetical protein QTG56_23435 [Rossellomorea sp. AcN35-11]
MNNILLIQKLENGTRVLFSKSKDEEHKKEFDGTEPSFLAPAIDQWLASLGAKKKKLKSFVILPYEKVKIHPIIPLSEFGNPDKMSSPLWRTFNKSKMNTMITLYLENKLEKEVDNYSFENMIGEINNDMGVTCVSVNKSFINQEVELLNTLEISLKGILIEQEALYHLCDTTGLYGVFNFFNDKERVVGLHVYQDDFLVGSRYLQMDVYQHLDLNLEMNLILDSCRDFIGDTSIEQYYVLSDEKEDLEKMRNTLGESNTKTINGNYLSLYGALKGV